MIYGSHTSAGRSFDHLQLCSIGESIKFNKVKLFVPAQSASSLHWHYFVINIQDDVIYPHHVM